jgi:hypothetical protein
LNLAEAGDEGSKLKNIDPLDRHEATTKSDGAAHEI